MLLYVRSQNSYYSHIVLQTIPFVTNNRKLYFSKCNVTLALVSYLTVETQI